MHKHPIKQTKLHVESEYVYFNTRTVQYSTVQYSTVQYSTVQYSTVQYTRLAQHIRVKPQCNKNESYNSRSRQLMPLSSALINFELEEILVRVDESFRYARGNIQSTLMQQLVLVLPGYES